MVAAKNKKTYPGSQSSAHAAMKTTGIKRKPTDSDLVNSQFFRGIIIVNYSHSFGISGTMLKDFFRGAFVSYLYYFSLLSREVAVYKLSCIAY